MWNLYLNQEYNTKNEHHYKYKNEMQRTDKPHHTVTSTYN